VCLARNRDITHQAITERYTRGLQREKKKKNDSYDTKSERSEGQVSKEQAEDNDACDKEGRTAALADFVHDAVATLLAMDGGLTQSDVVDTRAGCGRRARSEGVVG
jgi:hypothetical protein